MIPNLLPADNHKIKMLKYLIFNPAEWKRSFFHRKFLKMLKYIEKDPPISINFRSREIFEYPLVPANTKVMW